MKTIGIVCEGDRDNDMIKAVVAHFMEEEFQFLWLQPSTEFGNIQNGSGWKGVWRWCRALSGSLHQYLTDIDPKIDLLIIQMDADVARCEKEAFCLAIDMKCPGQLQEDPLNCSIAKGGNCAQKLPPNGVCDGSVKERTDYLRKVITNLLALDGSESVVITIPCDSTDTWVLAAFEDGLTDAERIVDPWSIITHRKEYHGIRIPKGKKSKKPYSQLIDHVCKNWALVKARCPQSLRFETDVKNALAKELQTAE